MLIMTVLVVNSFVILLLAYTLSEAKHRDEREVRTTTENLSLLLDHNVTALVSKIDLSLIEIADEFEKELQLSGHLDNGKMGDLLATRRVWLPEVSNFRVTVVSSDARPGPGIAARTNFTDLKFFNARRGPHDSGLIVTNLIARRDSQNWIIDFTRPYNHPDGSFAGVISAAVPISNFVQLLSGLDLGPHGVALLRDADTALVARYPPVAFAAQPLGSKILSKELQTIISSGAAVRTYHIEQSGDHVERTNTYRRLSAVPFHLVVGMAADDYLADWRGSVRQAVAVAAIFLIFTTVLAWLLWRSSSLIEKTSERSRLLLQHASDGIHILNLHGNVIEASDSFCRMLGYTRAEVIGMNVNQWDAMFTPDELRQAIVQQFERHAITTFETRQRRKDGSIVEVELTGYPLELDGRPVLYNSSRDITERKRAEDERRIAAVAFESREGILVTDANNIIIRVNRTFTELSGYEAGDVVGQSTKLLRSGRHDADFYAVMWHAIQQEGFWRGEIWNRRKNGEVYPAWLTITAVRAEEGTVTHYVGIFSDITRRVEDELEIRNLAFYDPLTGLANRRLLTDRLRHAFAKSSRSRSHGAVLFIDLDRFKELNDTLGHAQGDRLLELVADRLAVNVREEDTVARFGGDEFVVLLEELDCDRSIAVDKAVAIAEKLRFALNLPYKLQPMHSWHCTPSIGVALFLGPDEEVESVLARADQGLYAAKEGGRNTVRFA